MDSLPLTEGLRKLLHCSVERRGVLLIVTIERPEVRNALHPPASHELAQVFDAFAATPDLHVAVLTGRGGQAFCAGNDLKHLAAEGSSPLPASGFGGLTGRFDLNKPVIAAVEGGAFGGGFELALACDLVIAASHASFSLPEPRVGLVATAGGLLRLPRQIPLKLAMGVVLAGQRVTAEEGRAFGFVNEVTPEGKALPAALAWAARILEGSPRAVRAAKALVREAMSSEDFGSLYRRQKQLPELMELYRSADAAEGARAFAEKRAPRWQP